MGDQLGYTDRSISFISSTVLPLLLSPAFTSSASCLSCWAVVM